MNIGSMLFDICRQTIDSGYLLERRHRARWNGMTEAVRDHDTPFLFASLVEAFSYQGIADARASAYLDLHGRITFGHVARGLERDPACPKLTTYWHFEGCRYGKLAQSCAEPEHFVTCPLPRHDLRNGRLNQMAYALFLFVRDVCGGDLVGWIDGVLAEADPGHVPHRVAVMRDALLAPLSQVYGISFKVLAMALAELLLAGDPDRERWVAAGATMIAVDTLVHNWLHQPGSPDRSGQSTPMGGCATSRVVAPRCWSRVHARSMLQLYAQTGLPISPASCSMRSGASVPKEG